MRKHLSFSRFAVFWVYFLGTRAARCTLWVMRGRFDLVKATAAGIRDFLLRKTGPRR